MNIFSPSNLEDPLYVQVLKNYQKGILFLQDKVAVRKYLATKNSWKEEFSEIFEIRLHLDWFDCAMDLIQEEDTFHSYETKQEAIYYLDRYYRPDVIGNIKQEKSWQWLIQRKNNVLDGIFDVYPQGVISFPIIQRPAASSLYAMGSVYSEVSLEIPVSSSEANIVNSLLNLGLCFRWTDEKMWGEVNVNVENEKKFLRAQKQFLKYFCIDLVDSEKYIERNLKINPYGKFFISKNEDKIRLIKSCLDEKKLECTLKITPS